MSVVIEKPAPEQQGPGKWGGWRAMVGKELKQNLPWAALALVAVSIGLVVAAMRPSDGPGSFHNYGGFDGIWNAVTLTLTLAGPLVGLLLGLLQIIPEQRRDLWAFLMHRPATRDTLLGGKVAAGLLLYVCATGLPLLGFALWARTPGHLAGPFDARLLLGALSSVLTGVVFYFTALLTALRPARWWGSRAIPIPAAIGVAALAAEMPDFWMAAMIALAAIAVFALAARGAFLTTGDYQTQPRTGRASLGAILYVGLIVVAAALIALGVGLHNILSPPRYGGMNGTGQYEITKTGQIVWMTYQNGIGIQLRALDGTPIRDSADGSPPSGDDILPPLDVFDPGTQDAGPGFSNPERYAQATGAGRMEEQWYYATGLRRLVDYAPRSRHLVGELGPHGFVAGGGTGAGRFPSPLLSVAGTMTGQELLMFAHAQYLVDQANRTVKSLGLPLQGNAETQAFVLASSGDSPDTRDGSASASPPGGSDFLVVSGARYLLLSNAGVPRSSMPLALPSPDSSWIQVAMTGDGERIFFWASSFGPAVPGEVWEYNGRGGLIRQVPLPPLPGSGQVHTTPLYVGVLLGAAMPPGVSVGYAGWVALARWAGNQDATAVWDNTVQSSQRGDRTGITFLMISLLTGSLAAGLAWRIGLRCAYGRGGLWAWTAGAFWLGLPGVLLLLCLRQWPAREPCPNCRRPRVVTRELCEHCGAPFAPPVRDGTEIFEERDAPT